MNTKDEARLSMYQAVIDFLKKNTEITGPLPQFAVIFLALEQNLGKLVLLGQELSSDRSGVTVSKNEQQTDIELRAANLSGKMVAYATLENNNELLALIKLTKTTLRKSKDNELVAHSLKLCDAAEAHLTDLAAYLVTQDEITALRDLCASFLVIMPKPSENKKDKAGVLQSFKKLLKDTDALLAKLDAVMLIIRFTNTEFYDHYTSSRSIVNTGARKLALQCKVTDARTGQGLTAATVVFEPGNGTKAKAMSGPDLTKVVKIASAKGGINFKTLPAGTYEVTVSKEGYVPQTTTVYVNDGELTSVNVALQPV